MPCIVFEALVKLWILFGDKHTNYFLWGHAPQKILIYQSLSSHIYPFIIFTGASQCMVGFDWYVHMCTILL